MRANIYQESLEISKNFPRKLSLRSLLHTSVQATAFSANSTSDLNNPARLPSNGLLEPTLVPLQVRQKENSWTRCCTIVPHVLKPKPKYCALPTCPILPIACDQTSQ